MGYENIEDRDFKDPWLWICLAGLGGVSIRLSVEGSEFNALDVVLPLMFVVGGIVFAVRRRTRVRMQALRDQAEYDEFDHEFEDDDEPPPHPG